MSYDDLCKHSFLELDELNDLIQSAQGECECSENSQIKCIRCLDRDKVILHHMLLVRKICGEFSRNSDLSIDDFMADGIIGLNLAIDEFDLEQSNKFFHFASNSIRWAISNGDIFAPLVSIPRGSRDQISQVSQRIDELEAQGESYTYSQLCEEFNISRVRLIEFLDIIRSRREKYRYEYNKHVQEEMIEGKNDKYNYNDEEWIYKNDVQVVLEVLTDYHREIIVSYYGIGVETKTLRKLSKEFGQSYEKTRKDYHKALERLKEHFNPDIKEEK